MPNVKYRLDEDGKKQYQRVADLLGPVGTPALDELLETVWFAAQDQVDD